MACPLRRPFIIKPIWEHASLGMDAGAVVDVRDAAELARDGWPIARPNRPCFAERFVEGREFNLSVLAGPTVPRSCRRPRSTSRPSPRASRGSSATGQVERESFEFHNTPRTFDFAPADRRLLDELAELARACWRLFGLRGYARVDFRVDAAGRPWILEINANPCLSPDAGFAAAVERAGIGFDRPSSGSSTMPSVNASITLQRSPSSPPYHLPLRVTPADRQAVGPSSSRPASSRRPKSTWPSSWSTSGSPRAGQRLLLRIRRGGRRASGLQLLRADRRHRGQLRPLLDRRRQGPGTRRHGPRADGRVRTPDPRAGGRRIYVETSSRGQYEPTRAFYERYGYRRKPCWKTSTPPATAR